MNYTARITKSCFAVAVCIKVGCLSMTTFSKRFNPTPGFQAGTGETLSKALHTPSHSCSPERGMGAPAS